MYYKLALWPDHNETQNTVYIFHGMYSTFVQTGALLLHYSPQVDLLHIPLQW